MPLIHNTIDIVMFYTKVFMFWIFWNREKRKINTLNITKPLYEIYKIDIFIQFYHNYNETIFRCNVFKTKIL